ncbi:MAG: hypothetical protein U0U67_13220 [Chitinophagales bacterium]
MNWFIELESGVFYIEISFFIYFNTTNSKVLIVRESKKNEYLDLSYSNDYPYCEIEKCSLISCDDESVREFIKQEEIDIDYLKTKIQNL